MVREKTGATFLEIIRFLENNNWNVELAFIELRERAR
jgi:translation elongation factor EF-Ts